MEVQAQQNAMGIPYLQQVLDSMDREELPMGEEESFLREVMGNA